MNQRKVWYIVGGVLIVAFLIYGATAFKTSLTPYVTIAEAISSGTKAQVAGVLVQNSTEYLDETQQHKFEISDEDGSSMVVIYNGVMPANFEEATKIVVVGQYNQDSFYAEQMLVKCPSKYQGIEQAEG